MLNAFVAVRNSLILGRKRKLLDEPSSLLASRELARLPVTKSLRRHPLRRPAGGGGRGAGSCSGTRSPIRTSVSGASRASADPTCFRIGFFPNPAHLVPKKLAVCKALHRQPEKRRALLVHSSLSSQGHRNGHGQGAQWSYHIIVASVVEFVCETSEQAVWKKALGDDTRWTRLLVRCEDVQLTVSEDFSQIACCMCCSCGLMNIWAHTGPSPC